MRLIWSGPAVADLAAIDQWLTENASPDVAVRILAGIDRRSEVLLNFPNAGRPFRNFRILRVSGTPFLILYRVEGDTVQLLAVRHERQNWQAGT